MTAKMPALFAKHPPKRPLDSLDAIVDDWIYRFGANGISKQMRDEVVDYCKEAPSFSKAVVRATDSKRPNGKIHNHQSRVPADVRELFKSKIMNHQTMVKKCKNFDELHDLLERLKPEGIGPVTLYDVATRIAAYLDLPIVSLYLHAGVRVGYFILFGKRSPRVERIPISELPAALRRLPADEIEDMLCAYRDYLKPWCAS